MQAYTYVEHGKFELLNKPKPELLDPRDAIVRVTLSSICTSDLHIKHGSVPRAGRDRRPRDGRYRRRYRCGRYFRQAR